MKPNCYNCIYRRNIPGDAHSICRHPEAHTGVNAIDALFDFFMQSKGDKSKSREKLNIKGNPHGIKSGWFVWPVNFDPVWLESCNGFTEKE